MPTKRVTKSQARSRPFYFDMENLTEFKDALMKIERRTPGFMAAFSSTNMRFAELLRSSVESGLPQAANDLLVIYKRLKKAGFELPLFGLVTICAGLLGKRRRRGIATIINEMATESPKKKMKRKA